MGQNGTAVWGESITNLQTVGIAALTSLIDLLSKLKPWSMNSSLNSLRWLMETLIHSKFGSKCCICRVGRAYSRDPPTPATTVGLASTLDPPYGFSRITHG